MVKEYKFELGPFLELLPALVFIGLAITGYIVSWFFERRSVVLMITASSAQGLYILLRGWIIQMAYLDHLGPALIYFYSLPFIIPELMFITCWILERNKASH